MKIRKPKHPTHQITERTSLGEDFRLRFVVLSRWLKCTESLDPGGTTQTHLPTIQGMWSVVHRALTFGDYGLGKWWKIVFWVAAIPTLHRQFCHVSLLASRRMAIPAFGLSLCNLECPCSHPSREVHKLQNDTLWIFWLLREVVFISFQKFLLLLLFSWRTV